MSVYSRRSTPKSRIRPANSVALISDISVQPRMATRPFRASSATTTRSLPKRRHKSSTQLRVGDGGGADHHAGRAGIEQAGRSLHAANSAAYLNRDRQTPGDGCNRGEVGWVARVRSVQIDDVQALSALSLPSFGDTQRIVGEDRLLVIVSLVQPDAVAAAQVDCGNDFHVCSYPWSAGRARCRATFPRRPAR